MKMEYANNTHLDIHTIKFEITDEEMHAAGIVKLARRPTELEVVRMLKRVAEYHFEEIPIIPIVGQKETVSNFDDMEDE